MSEENNEKTRLRSASRSNLPIASVIDDPETFRRAVDLLKKAVSLKARISEMSDKEKEIRDELSSVCEGYGLKGFRHGKAGFEYHGWTTRRTLSKERLLAAGVSAEQINDAYTESEPYQFAKLLVFDLE